MTRRNDPASLKQPHPTDQALSLVESTQNEVRLCPGCFGPIALVESGTDAKGDWYERWRCERLCDHISLYERERGTVRGSEIILREKDYRDAAAKRAKVANLIVRDRKRREREEKKRGAASA